MNDFQRREFHEALVDADTSEDLPGKWQAAILKAEQNRPTPRVLVAVEPKRPLDGVAHGGLVVHPPGCAWAERRA